MKNLVLLSVLLFFVSAVSSNTSSRSSKPYKVVCYLGSWANYRPGDGKFVIENIDPYLCTHLIYGFAKLSYDNKIAPYDPYLDLKENWGLGGYQRFNNLKQKNPSLKTLIAIGGWNEGSTKYSRMASSSATRKIFVDSCVNFLKKYGFDGLDLDWEYPANRGGKPEDKQNFVLLLKELKEAFQPHGFLLTAAVSAGKKTIDTAYDIPALAKYMDFINLMAYDFHGGWEKFTGHNAPLYPRPSESEFNKTLNVEYAVNYWLSKGCPSNKLILGMPLYGRGFALKDPKKNGLDVSVTGKSMPGPFTREPGMMGYNEICKMLQTEKGWTVVFEPTIQAPYTFKDRQWIGYDNQKSIYLKTQYMVKMNLGGAMEEYGELKLTQYLVKRNLGGTMVKTQYLVKRNLGGTMVKTQYLVKMNLGGTMTQYLVKRNLGGAMVWSIETDDFRGRCHGQQYPLLRTINEILGKRIDNTTKPVRINGTTKPARENSITPEIIKKHSSVSPTFSTPKTTSAPERTTSNEVEDMLPCPYSGYFKHPHDCKLFYFCQPEGAGNKGNVYYMFRCGEGTVFSQNLRVCTYPHSVPGCEAYS